MVNKITKADRLRNEIYSLSFYQNFSPDSIRTCIEFDLSESCLGQITDLINKEQKVKLDNLKEELRKWYAANGGAPPEGMAKGEICHRDGCRGTMQYQDNPDDPCGCPDCVEKYLVCSVCGYET